MAKQSFISHTVNGYSRYDVPESKAFTCTPGILYPVRIDFINARDRVSIAQGIDVRSNPLAVPSFNPYTVRLHRFWVPMQLYHPEMRTNSSNFDMNSVSLNWYVTLRRVSNSAWPSSSGSYSNSLLFWLRSNQHDIPQITSVSDYGSTTLPADAPASNWANADSYLAYWDIVRNYYSYSQWRLYSFAWPSSWYVFGSGLPTASNTAGSLSGFTYTSSACYFNQRYGNLEFLDAYFETQFYPASVLTSNNSYNRGNLWRQIIFSDLATTGAAASNGYPVTMTYPTATSVGDSSSAPAGQFSLESGTNTIYTADLFNLAHPMAVVPSNPDRFSRLIPYGSSDAVSMTGVSTIPQLAIASRLQEYKDLLGAGGSRYSDWLETFFASKIEHVDRPKLLFSASQTVNVQVVMNQAGNGNLQTAEGFPPLGQQGGAIAFNTQLGRSQSYYFREPGYLIDMLSIRPVYYWAGIRPDYLGYTGSDYFNPIYNDIGYQDVSVTQFAGVGQTAIAREPCFNEFRSSYDEVLGQLSLYSSLNQAGGNLVPLYSYWVQQREAYSPNIGYYPALFVDISKVNSPFASNVEDNFFVNMSYSVRKKNLVNKTFATRLSNR